MKEKATLKDVARESNVSITTASRALADYWDVSPQTKARVQAVARKLNYSPNLFAKSLVRGESTLLGVYVDDDGISLFEQPFFLPVVCGIRDRASELGMHVMMLARPEGQSSLVDVTRSTQVSGLIVMGLTSNHPDLDELPSSNIPTVTIDIECRGKRMQMITSDNVVQAEAVTKHLIEQGCQSILFVGGKTNTTVHQARAEGYRRALERSGFPRSAQRMVIGEFDKERAKQAVLEAWSEAPFDAVFAASDLMAIGVYSALQELNLSIPEDVAVAGYDDLAIVSYLDPALTTVRQQPVAMGRAAVDSLQQLSSGKEVTTKPIEIASRLIVRESSLKVRFD